MKTFKLYVFVLFIAPFILCAQTERQVYTINDGWQFLNQGIAFGQHDDFVNDTSWQTVSIPHSWNASDPFDDDKSYKRGIGWYRKIIKLSKNELINKSIFLHFEGANQVADVFVNGIHVGRHKGGYTAFTFDITHALMEGNEQLVAVMVNNAHDPFIPPLSVGYALYGGIYRDVWVVVTDKVHFDMMDHGSKGVFITTPRVSDANASVSITGHLKNDSTSAMNDLIIESTVYDASMKEIAKTASRVSVNGSSKIAFDQNITINNPKLWSPKSPYLYSVKSKIIYNGKLLDELVNPLGLRWYSIDPSKGFSLNGKPLKLKGTNRHQDMYQKGSALSNEDHRRDMQIIKDMGANFIRIAHYPQDPEILRAADELGLLAWEEVPLVNYMTIDEEFVNNSKTMIKEMIRQHYNHPAVIMWGSMNEIFLWGNNEDRISKQIDTVYTKNVAAIAKQLNHLIKTEDPNRFTTLAMHMSSDYDKVGIEDTPDIASYNIYSGWYGGKFEDFGTSFDKKHSKKPHQNIFISEYGAGSDLRLNSSNPLRFDFTGQYQRMFHESYIEQINERDFIFGSAIWNQFDFSQPHVGGSIPHINQKGMGTWDRKLKDVYYLYKANWNEAPMVYIAERDWLNRQTVGSETFDITVYSNLTTVDLYLNGKKKGSKQPNNIHKTTWPLTLHPGKNYLRVLGKANGKVIEDNIVVTVNDINEAATFAINIGSNAQYTDHSDLTWIQDASFNGTYGYQMGKPTLMNRKYIIRDSKHDPMYYTYLDGVDNYKLKLANGVYQLSLYFIENEKINPGERVFNLNINGKKALENFDLTEEAGFCYGVEKTFKVNVTDGTIIIDFEAIKGTSILSGLKISKTN